MEDSARAIRFAWVTWYGNPLEGARKKPHYNAIQTGQKLQKNENHICFLVNLFSWSVISERLTKLFQVAIFWPKYHLAEERGSRSFPYSCWINFQSFAVISQYQPLTSPSISCTVPEWWIVMACSDQILYGFFLHIIQAFRTSEKFLNLILELKQKPPKVLHLIHLTSSPSKVSKNTTNKLKKLKDAPTKVLQHKTIIQGVFLNCPPLKS